MVLQSTQFPVPETSEWESQSHVPTRSRRVLWVKRPAGGGMVGSCSSTATSGWSLGMWSQSGQTLCFRRTANPHFPIFKCWQINHTGTNTVFTKQEHLGWIQPLGFLCSLWMSSLPHCPSFSPAYWLSSRTYSLLKKFKLVPSCPSPLS